MNATRVNYGTWFVWNPQSQRIGDGAFGVNRHMRTEEFFDGLSNTVGLAEVRAHQPLLHDGGAPNAPNVPAPNTPAAVLAYGGPFDPELGHSEWINGMMVQTGMTTTFPPNTAMTYTSGGAPVDVDFVSSRLGVSATRLTDGVINSRSYHRSGVNVLFMDSSVRGVTDRIAMGTWRALGPRAGGDAATDFWSCPSIVAKGTDSPRKQGVVAPAPKSWRFGNP